jgi:hypothetical protein
MSSGASVPTSTRLVIFDQLVGELGGRTAIHRALRGQIPVSVAHVGERLRRSPARSSKIAVD